MIHRFFQGLVILSLCLLFSCSQTENKETPNILWITSEDNGKFLGCYGDEIAATPNLDALAGQGVRYTSCFANAPVCALVRSSWILGVPAVSTGTHNMRSHYRVPEALKPYPVLLKEAGYYVTNNSKTDYNTSSFGKEIWDECSGEAHYRNRAEGQPFFAVFNIGVSHEGQIFERFYPDKYPPPSTPAGGIQVPPYQVKTPETIRDWQRMYDRIHDMDAEVGRLLNELKEAGEAENTIIFYCSDHGGITLRSKRFLFDSGTRVPFIIYVPEKWKHMMPGEPGTASDRLCQFIDMPVTFLSLAGADVPQHMPGKILAGPGRDPAPESVLLFSGRFDEAPDMSRAVTDGRWKYIRNYEPDRPFFQMLSYPLNQSGQVSQYEEYMAGRTNELQSAQYGLQPPELLFDTRADPHEISNLAGDPGYSERLDRMRNLLDRHLMEVRDAGFIAEPMLARLDRDSGTTIYDFCQDLNRYPLEEILPFAGTAGLQDASNLATMVSGLNQENPVIRYWAVLGLRLLGDRAAPAEEELRGALKDPAEEVRITAALALGNLGFREEAAIVLLAEARRADNDAWANWALDGLRYLEIPDAIRGVSEDEVVKGNYSKRTYDHLKGGGTIRLMPENE